MESVQTLDTAEALDAAATSPSVETSPSFEGSHFNDERTAVSRVTFYFDPACPWTWRTSRWLVEAAAARGVPVEYAAFELSAGRPIDQAAPEHQAAAVASRLFLRGLVAAREEGRHGLIASWYTAYGTALWEEGTEPSADLVRRTLTASGGTDLMHTLDDTHLDAAVATSRTDALEWAGDDVGSPVTVWHVAGGHRGFFGPVVAPAPTGSGSDALWDAVVAAAAVPEFFELKSRRTSSPIERLSDRPSGESNGVQ